jgi:hypothetical protein
MRHRLITASLAVAFATLAPESRSQPATGEMVIEDFTDVVTPLDRSWNDFSGNRIDTNTDLVAISLRRSSDRSALSLRWNFSASPGNPDAFTGIFFSLFGMNETEATYDGTSTVFVAFPEHALDMDLLDAPLQERRGPRRANAVTMDVSRRGTNALSLRLELRDGQGRGRFIRLPVRVSRNVQRLRWNFRSEDSFTPLAAGDADLHAIKLIGVLVEKQPGADAQNPDEGSVDISRIALETDHPDLIPQSDDDWMDAAEIRACQYFFDWAGRKPASAGLPQDRSSFADLLAPAAVGYALPACIIAAERKWIDRAAAASHALRVIRVLDDESAFGAESVGRIGYRGWFYRFLGSDGRRKLNYDYKDTPIDERLNTVEIDPADTALLLMGVLAAQSYFQQETPEDVEIRKRAQMIFDRVDWFFMLDPATLQFRHGWKPNEKREGPVYEILDPDGHGAFAGVPGRPELYSTYSDACTLLALLAAGSSVRETPSPVWCAWSRQLDETGFMRSGSGALATFQLLHAFIDTRELHAPVCVDQPRVNWYENSRNAIQRAITVARRNKFSTYSPDAWGVSGTEGPFEIYHAYGFGNLALTNLTPALEDGTVTYSAMISAASFGDDLKLRAVSALKSAWRRGHWHARFGPVSAFNDDISQAGVDTEAQKFDSVFRRHGPWVQHSLFAHQQGPALLHLENARSGLIWNLLARNLNVQRAFDRLAAPPEITIEAEKSETAGRRNARTQARGQETVQLMPQDALTANFEIRAAASYALVVRYSNDSYGPPEKVEVLVDGNTLATFSAFDTAQYIGTGSYGSGWNVFVSSEELGPVDLEPGVHTITLTVRSGDAHGVEIDSLHLKRVTAP